MIDTSTQAIKDMQRILGVTQDGIIGKQTIEAIKRNKLGRHHRRMSTISKIYG